MFAGSGTELHGVRAGRPRFVRVLIAEDLLVEVRGELGEPGQRTTRRCGTAAAATARAEAVVAAARRGGLSRVTTRPFTAAAVAPEALEEAFTDAWADFWHDRIADLADRSVECGPWRVLVARGWAAQTRAQPWGPALTAIARAGVWAHVADSDVALLRTGDRVTAWLRAYYGGAGLPPVADLAAGAEADTAEIYRMALGLWQPRLEGPLAQLRQALDTARMMLS